MPSAPTLDRRNVENRFRFFPSNAAEPLVHGFAVVDPARKESSAVIDELDAFFREQI